MGPHLALMQQADVAERRGDALGAVEIMMRRPLDPDGRPFWRPSRLRRLSQIVRFAPLLPDWAIGRWLLAQAAQSLDPAEHGPHLRAVDVAVELRGGMSALPGVDDDDRRTKVMDHDWVHRQVYLYELGGLDRFLRDHAAPEVVAEAGPVGEWSRTPMGAFRLVEKKPSTVVWHDLATGTDIEVINTGCAGLLVVGEHALGRLIPTSSVPAFESVPLLVERSCAEAVAADPACWLDALWADPPLIDGTVATDGRDFDLLSDLPDVVWILALSPLPDLEPATLAFAILERARALLHDEPTLTSDPEGPDQWATLAAAVVEPGVADAVRAAIRPKDHDVLRHLAHQLAEPAASVCRLLVTDLNRAA